MDDESGDDNRDELNEEVSRDMTGEADGKNPGVDSTDGMHIWGGFKMHTSSVELFS